MFKRMNDEAQGVYSFALVSMPSFVTRSDTAAACLYWREVILHEGHVNCLLCGAKIGPDYEYAAAVVIMQATEYPTISTISTICSVCGSAHPAQAVFDRAFAALTDALGMDGARRFDMHPTAVGRA